MSTRVRWLLLTGGVVAALLGLALFLRGDGTAGCRGGAGASPAGATQETAAPPRGAVPLPASAVLPRVGRLHDDSFSSAPAAWRSAGAALTEVANRWQCDPRWSFFSLKNDRRVGKAAVLWSKYLYPRDVAVQFCVANKMERERGEPYTYARDINVTICGDGSDLTKGYTFMWGGHNNTASLILRNGVEVQRCDARIPTDKTYHNCWFSYRVEKQGGRLSFSVAGMGRTLAALAYDDTEPLQGDRVAIWTYDHAIMLARARLSGDGGVVEEDPDWQPGLLKTPYDGQ